MRFAWLVGLLVFLAACQNDTKPDLATLYQQHGTDHSNTPLVLIHGTTGSKLRNQLTGEEIWPGKLSDLVFSKYENLANKIDPKTLEVADDGIDSYAIFDAVSGISIYDDIIKTLTTYGGYELSDMFTEQHTGRPLYLFHYDWRQDNVESAQKLSQFIDRVLSKHPEHQQVDVVAHSMGGLITRYYLNYGSHDVLETEKFPINLAPKTIRHAIFLGTPQLGSVIAIKRLLHGFEFNLRTVPVAVQLTMPSVIQLLPHPDSHWSISPAGEPEFLDLYRPKLWRFHQWSIYNPQIQAEIRAQHTDPEAAQAHIDTLSHFFDKQLLRAKQFWRSISLQIKGAHNGFIVMGGDCKKTLSHLIIEPTQNRKILQHDWTHLDDKAIRNNYAQWLFQPGDGQVSKASLLGVVHDVQTHETINTSQNKYPVFVCEDHISLTQNLTFQDNLLHILLN